MKLSYHINAAEDTTHRLTPNPKQDFVEHRQEIGHDSRQTCKVK